MKHPYLVLYDYGQGGVWAYILAESKAQIRNTFPDLVVHDEPPKWMSAEELDSIRKKMTIDIADDHSRFLSRLLRKEERS